MDFIKARSDMLKNEQCARKQIFAFFTFSQGLWLNCLFVIFPCNGLCRLTVFARPEYSNIRQARQI